jgi:hypothetical protein
MRKREIEEVVQKINSMKMNKNQARSKLLGEQWFLGRTGCIIQSKGKDTRGSPSNA